MGFFKAEYIWLDGYEPTQSLRSKTRIINNFNGLLKDCPMWNFDGSSTQQAEGYDSDCLIKPVAIYSDPCRENSYLVIDTKKGLLVFFLHCMDGKYVKHL